MTRMVAGSAISFTDASLMRPRLCRLRRPWPRRRRSRHSRGRMSDASVNDMADPATILVIEDDASLNAALAATLKAAGYRPVSARSAAEGLRWFAHYGPDLVLLDLGLPDRDGLSVIADIRAKGQTPIVVLSAITLRPSRSGRPRSSSTR